MFVEIFVSVLATIYFILINLRIVRKEEEFNKRIAKLTKRVHYESYRTDVVVRKQELKEKVIKKKVLAKRGRRVTKKRS